MLRRIMLIVVLAVACLLGGAYYVVTGQGVPDDFWQKFELAEVRFDEHGIPTLKASDWLDLIEAQGYVVASERLWQMDLLRRKAGGTLSEWFGAKAYEFDASVQREGRLDVAQEAARLLPEDQKNVCQRFAAGVNKFIDDHPYRWGVEYPLQGTRPQAWQCRDTMLILIELMQQLTASAPREANLYAWGKHLPAAWSAFIFPQEHPWNQPYFGSGGKGPVLPPAADWLAAAPLQDGDEAQVKVVERLSAGSNNWAYRGERGHFLANDPHLRQSVPGIWYAMRLKIGPDDWAVGVTVPGVPGVILGMNAHLAWSFTNTGEDVDDLLEETLSADGQQYEDWDGQGKSVWRPIVTKHYQIHVRGEGKPRELTAQFTKRGPLYRWPNLDDKPYSRQWLALQAPLLRVPSLSLMQAKDLVSFNKAVDEFKAPAQNIVVLDRAGNMGYRNSGTGVLRSQSGLWPLPARTGAWQGFAGVEDRRSFWYGNDGQDTHRFIATANERIWVDSYGHHWASDDRKVRIKSLLEKRRDYSHEDMQQLQLDTQSRFRKQLLMWVLKHRGDVEDRWQAWDGSARDDSVAFQQAAQAEEILTGLLVGRLKKRYLPADLDVVIYSHKQQRAWLLAILGDDRALQAFGLQAAEVAHYIDRKINPPSGGAYEINNRWQAQHPFVDQLPIVGLLFRVKEIPQFGGSDTLAAEQALHGPSVRLVWDLSHPEQSSWLLPVGQSGHVAAQAFDSMHLLWQKNEPLKVFPDPEEWHLGDKKS